MPSEKSQAGWYYLLVVTIIFIATIIIKPAIFIPIFNFFLSLLKKIAPVFIFVFILMIFTNYLISPKKLSKYLGKGSGIKGWLIAIVGGILSTGPIYMWYPWLADLISKGTRTGLIATFLYNRAVKIPLLPLMFFYFNLKYVLVLTLVMIIMSIANGLIIETIIKK